MDYYKDVSDAELLLFLKNGDEHAFNEIYSRYFSFLYRYAGNILKNEEECSDVIQEIFVWLWENRQKLDISSLKSYLGASVKYKLARVIKTSKRHAEIISANVEFKTFTRMEEDMEVKELKKVIDGFIETLPTRAKEVFLLSRHQHLSNKEIATRLGISEKTVENQITISLKKLKTDLTKRLLTLFFI